MSTLNAFWEDEAGVVISTELILVVAMLGIGLIVGLNTLRNDVVTELADTAQAVSNIDQSYFYNGVSGASAATAGSSFSDESDFGESGVGGTNEQCVVINPGQPTSGSD